VLPTTKRNGHELRTQHHVQRLLRYRMCRRRLL